MEEAFERKCLKYSELALEATQNGRKVRIFPVEVRRRGFHHQPIEVNGGLGVALSNKQSSPCRIQREEAGIGGGLKGRISAGRRDEDGRTRRTPGVTFKPSGDVMGSSMKEVPTEISLLTSGVPTFPRD